MRGTFVEKSHLKIGLKVKIKREARNLSPKHDLAYRFGELTIEQYWESADLGWRVDIKSVERPDIRLNFIGIGLLELA